MVALNGILLNFYCFLFCSSLCHVVYFKYLKIIDIVALSGALLSMFQKVYKLITSIRIYNQVFVEFFFKK